jgi:uncharacterized membrane protein YdjX (TVP38/TMEM64 family)
MLGMLGGLYVVGRWLGLSQYLDAERLRALVESSGPYGAIAFVAVFVAAVVAQVPGFVFVLVAPALFSALEAWVLCILASNVAVWLNFELARRIGGQPLADVERPWMKRLFASLDRRPVRSIALLRVVTIMFPPVTTALALTGVGARDHAVGSFLGMLLPVTGLVLVGALLT